MKRKGFLNRVICLALVGAFVFGLAGCGDATNSSSDDITTITIWSSSSHSRELYTRLVDEFNNTTGKKEGIKVVYEIKEGNIGQAIDLALASDQAPELFIGGNIATLAEKGQIIALEDVKGGQELIDKYKDKLVPFTNTYNGKTYTIPAGAMLTALVYNKDMFKAAGLVDENGEPTPPKTMKELREYAKKLTNVSKSEFGIMLPLKWSGWFGSDIESVVIASYGRKGYDPATGKFDYSIYKPVIDTFMGIKEDKSYVPGAEGIDNDPARAHFSEGKVGMKFAGQFDVAVYNDQFPAKINWGVAPIPVVDPDNRYCQQISYGNSARINAKAVEKVGEEKLMTVYKWLYSDEVLAAAYIDCLTIPVDQEIIAETKIDNPKNGWVEFSEMTSICAMQPVELRTDVTGQKTLAELFVNEIWTGRQTVSSVLDSYTKMMNEAALKYQENNPTYSPDDFINPDWEAKRLD